jgi:hypothetical protein
MYIGEMFLYPKWVEIIINKVKLRYRMPINDESMHICDMNTYTFIRVYNFYTILYIIMNIYPYTGEMFLYPKWVEIISNKVKLRCGVI